LSDIVDQLLTRRTQQLRRWHLHRTNGQETLAEHQAQTARIAVEIALLCIHHCVYGEGDEVPRPTECATAALYHDEAETLVSDVSASFKYTHPEAREMIHQWEREAVSELWNPYPTLVQTSLQDYTLEVDLTEQEQQIVKYSDALSALSFIREEQDRGNRQFDHIHARQMRVMGTFDWPWLQVLRRKIKDLP